MFGIPLGTLAASTIGWRGTFWSLSGLSILVAILLALTCPSLARPERVRIAEQLRILRDPFFVGRNPLGATLLTVAILALGMIAVPAPAGSTIGLLLGMAVWGIANAALYPICQVRVMKSAVHAQALAGTLNVAMANAGIGPSAIFGGLALRHFGLWSLGCVAAAIAVLAMATVPIVARLGRGAGR
ncbi:MFS transporter [Lichenicola cladoniae]|uniref:MFS transporter n=1 Tax=Lichenicola cladoniae TaxID=1484109 RepID=A0A6M8HLU8_9PROT|nr:MFS transporter [Lichenicola cladoniae]NPD69933.1 MFS transporter [Acetobacteraceae bacterium]QKE89353.1 MFS transporter [Lichenicola cladoniae]